MKHPEPEDLALAALGEPLDGATRDHLESCETCRAEVASFTTAVSVGRAVAADGSDTLVAPPVQVWSRIREELGLSADLEPGEVRTGAAAEGADPGVIAEPAAAGPVAPAPEATAEVHVLRDRSRRTSGGPTRRPIARWIAVAAAAGVVVGGGGATLWAGRGSPAPAVVEAAALDALPGWTGATGKATVEVSADGSRHLVVTLGGAKAESGYHEVWLIDTGVTKLVSIGVLDGATGSFDLPPGLDLGQFPVVDISEEHFDGNPTHSGDSIVRGVLES